MFFLRHLQHPPKIPGKEPPTLMSLAAYKESLKLVKENTLPQVPHIRMDKAAAQQPLLGWIFHQNY